MKRFLKNYGFTLLLLAGIIAGAVCGLVFGEKASVVRPLGDFFLNMMFVLVVPLVFFSMATAFCNMKRSGTIVRTLGVSVLVFVIMSFLTGALTYGGVLLWKPLDTSALPEMPTLLSGERGESFSFGDTLVQALTVPDFLSLFDKSHLLPLILFSSLLGYAVALLRQRGEKVAAALQTGLDITVTMVKLVMYLAPVCLGCYIADIIGRLGGAVADGYMRIVVQYIILTVIVFFGLYSILVFAARGRKGLKAFWTHIHTPALTAMASCSSAACIPMGIEAAKRMGVKPQVAESVIPLGTNLHKDGSVIGSFLKIAFVMSLYGMPYQSVGQFFLYMGIALLVGCVMGAVPTGGMTGELLICAMLGFPPEMAASLMIIGTLVDMPATLVNVTANVTAAVWIDRLTAISRRR